MDTELYKSQQQNFLLILEYFNKTKIKAENYCTYIQKYKEHTKHYLIQIKRLYKDFLSSLYDKNIDSLDKNSNVNEEMNIDDDDDEDDEDLDKHIFDLDLNKNKENIEKKRSSLIKKDIINNFNLDLSPINKLTNCIYKQFRNQINGLKLFLKGIDLSVDNYKSLINKLKKETKQIEGNYLDIKQNLFQYFSSYQKDSSELLNEFSSIENKLIELSFLKSNGDIFKKNKNKADDINLNDIENNINVEIIEIKKKEANFIKKDSYKKKYYTDFNNKSEEYIKKINNNIILLINNLKSSIEKFLSYYSNCYHFNFKELSPNIKDLQKMNNEKEYENIIKQNLKPVNENILLNTYELYKTFNYDIKVIKNKKIDLNLYDKLIKEGYEIRQEDFELSDYDIYYVAKKMFNFSLVNKGNYDIDKENNKAMISKCFDYMFYSKEKNPKVYEKYKIALEEKKSKLFKTIEESKECQKYSLQILSNMRAKGIYELTNNVHEILSKILLIISDKTLQKMDYYLANNVLILSQTFYKMENNEKIYLYQNLIGHQLYKKEEFWSDYINNEIVVHIKKKELNEKQIGRILDEKDIIKRNNDIVFAQLMTMAECMKNLGLEEKQIINVFTPMFDTYKMEDDKKETILQYLNMS